RDCRGRSSGGDRHRVQQSLHHHLVPAGHPRGGPRRGPPTRAGPAPATQHRALDRGMVVGEVAVAAVVAPLMGLLRRHGDLLWSRRFGTPVSTRGSVPAWVWIPLSTRRERGLVPARPHRGWRMPRWRGSRSVLHYSHGVEPAQRADGGGPG